VQDLYQKQIELEEEYANQSIIESQQQVLDAYAQGRAADIGRGRILIAKAYDTALGSMHELMDSKKRVYGLNGKHLKMLRQLSAEKATMIGLRVIVGGCADDKVHLLQAILHEIGRCIEVEILCERLTQTSEQYTKRTLDYLETSGTKAINHRYRTFRAGAEKLGLEWNTWSSTERAAVGKLVCTVLYDTTGLFKWVRNNDTAPFTLEPSEELHRYLMEAVEASKAVTRLPPMLVPPEDWEGIYNGGYHTDWCKAHASMVSLRNTPKELRSWVVTGLSAPAAQPLRSAMNKAQNTAYRVNTQVMEILSQALALRVGILGLPATAPKPKPEFPFGDSWLKGDATVEELETFQHWKRTVAAWHTEEVKRTGRKVSILSKLRELRRYSSEERLYFPTFIDWRGRLYFRSTLHPQLNDAVKGCLEFAEGKPLGTEGLFWLKVHVANSCGYDKHSPEIKAKWTDDNWEMICDFIDNPLDVDAPEPDTAFTLLQAGLALQAALRLDAPTEYICHVPVAMDATCSGLQHLSALTRDTVGATYTNLIDSEGDEKADIYAHGARVAEGLKESFTDDEVILKYWSNKPITRKMAKKPTMTLVYGSTLLSTIDSVALDMTDAGYDCITDGHNILYSINKLATPIAKSLRKAVQDTVPMCTEMMGYMQRVTRSRDADCFKWITPVGVPVVNWAATRAESQMRIDSMGITRIIYAYSSAEYSHRIATNGIVPNFVHSMDSAHLCMTLNAFSGSVVPIHDSFGTHPSDVPEMHVALRKTFVELYSQFDMESFMRLNNVDLEESPLPNRGDLDLDLVLDSRFMFC